MFEYEKEIIKAFDHAFIISEQDAQSLAEEVKNQIKILPNGVDDEFFAPNPSIEKKYEVVFTGNMSYPPNVDAAIFLAEKIMPIIWKTLPEAKLLIAGASPAPQVKNLSSDKVFVSGWMDDIRTAYYEGKVFVAPLRIGSGLQNKLLEAMCTEIPCVTSNLANNALQAIPNESIMVCETDEEYANAVINLLKNENEYQKIAKRGNEFVKAHYNWRSANNLLEKAIF